MEKDLVVLYEAAKKAADAAAAEDGGSAEESLCLDALTELKDFPVNYQILVDTQVGKRLRHLTKHPRKPIQTFAADLIEIWKKIIIEETTRKKNGNSDNKLSADGEGKKRAISVKAEKTSEPSIVKSEPDIVKREPGFSPRPTKRAISVKAESNVKSESDIVKREPDFSPRPAKMAKSEDSVKIENGSLAQPVKTNTTVKQERHPSDSKKRPSSVSNGPPKLTNMIKCNDEARDNVRKVVCEALSKVSGEADESIRDEVEACDPVRVAVTVESVLFENWGRSTGTHKVKYRSILFNLKDHKNPDFRRKVLLGHVLAESIPTLTAEEMASEERKMETEKIKEKALFECERGGKGLATTDQFKCGRCGQRKTSYYQMQTRSADEPMTTYVTCVNCNNHWKFC